MERLEEAVQEVLGQSFERENKWDYGKRLRQDVLFFPRNKIKLMKVRSGDWEPAAWFIQSRTKEKSTKLELPTAISHEGLTSGYRAGIILDRKGEYWKLKGICLGTLVGKPKERGLCDFMEVVGEQTNAIGLTYEGWPALEVRPGYMESFHLPKEQTIRGFMEVYQKPREFILTEKVNEYNIKTFKREIRKYDHFIKTVGPKLTRNHYFVSALRINADTRLDEAIYHLTKKELGGTIRKERDNILQTLAFRVGISKATLNFHNLAWGNNLRYTDNHLGNFVLTTTPSGMFDAGVADISAMTRPSEFNSTTEYCNHLEREVESLARDFYSRTTFSTPTPLRHRYYPMELREECANALRTGYAMMLHFIRHDEKDIRPIPKPEKLFVPINFMMSVEEFKYIRDKITK